MMLCIKEYKIHFFTYHDEIVGRISYNIPGYGVETSAIYSLSEINNIINLWKSKELCGSFGIGTYLSEFATVSFHG